MTTYATPDINALITTALKDVIKQAVEAHIDDRLEALDVDVASTLVYFNRKHKDLEAENALLRTQAATLGECLKAHTDQIKALEKRINRLETDKTDRAFERDDIIADMVETCVDKALKNVDLTKQVRYVLSDARLTITNTGF